MSDHHSTASVLKPLKNGYKYEVVNNFIGFI